VTRPSLLLACNLAHRPGSWCRWTSEALL
jgi:hypothetical protein